MWEINPSIYMIKFQKNIENIKSDTGENTLSKAIAKVMGYNSHE